MWNTWGDNVSSDTKGESEEGLSFPVGEATQKCPVQEGFLKHNRNL